MCVGKAQAASAINVEFWGPFEIQVSIDNQETVGDRLMIQLKKPVTGRNCICGAVCGIIAVNEVAQVEVV